MYTCVMNTQTNVRRHYRAVHLSMLVIEYELELKLLGLSRLRPVSDNLSIMSV